MSESLSSFDFEYTPTETVYGRGCVSKLSAILGSKNVKTISFIGGGKLSASMSVEGRCQRYPPTGRDGGSHHEPISLRFPPRFDKSGDRRGLRPLWPSIPASRWLSRTRENLRLRPYPRPEETKWSARLNFPRRGDLDCRLRTRRLRRLRRGEHPKRGRQRVYFRNKSRILQIDSRRASRAAWQF